MRILGIDPGDTNGLSLISDKRVIETLETVDCLEIFEFIKRTKPQVLVVERFIVSYRKRGREIEGAIKIIGIVEFISKIMKIELVMQSPAKLQSRSVLKWLPEGLGRHARSATIHALAYESSHSK